MVQNEVMHMARLLRHRMRNVTWPTSLLGVAASVLICAGALTGCGEIAFKRGSGPDAFAADRRHCQSQNADPAAVHACLAQAGWHVTDMESSAASANGTAVAAATVPTQAAPALPPVSAAPSIQPPDALPPSPSASATALSVGGWWKYGAGAADLHAAADACVAKLGPANAPDKGYHTVTPALYACLRGSGWHGIARRN
jgi:hypothetical protein